MLPQGFLKVEGGRGEESVGGRCDGGRKSQRGATLLALKMEEGTRSQGMWEVSTSWKGQGNKLSLEPPEGTQLC